MERRMRIVMGGCAIALLGAVSMAGAEVARLNPDQAGVVTAEGVEDTRVALRFDLSGLSKARVDLAVLEWPVEGMAADGWTEVRLVPITAGWTEAGLTAEVALTLAEEDAGWWEFSPRDYERNGGGLIRFDVTALVSAWAQGETADYGVAVVTGDLDRVTLADQLGKATLIVTYLPEK